jgi:hypothetical protein
MEDKRLFSRKHKTLPEFVIEENGKWKDLLTLAKNASSYDDIQQYSKYLGKYELLRLYLAFNKEYNEQEDMRGFTDIMLEKYISRNELVNLQKNLSDLRDKLKKQIKEVSEETDLVKELNSIKVPTPLSFSMDEVEIEYTLSHTYDLYALFDAFIPTEDACFGRIGHMTKVFKDTPELKDKKEWFETMNENTLQIYMIKNRQTKSVIDRFMSIVVEPTSIRVFVRTRERTTEGYIQRIWEIIEPLFPTVTFDVQESVETKFKGYYLIPDQIFNKYLFSDYIMFDKIASKFMVSIEMATASRKTNSIYTYLMLPEKEPMRVILEGRIAVQEDTYTRTERSTFPIDSNYILVKLENPKDVTKKDITNISMFINRIVSRYNKLYSNIEKIYKSYIPEFSVEKAFKKKPKKKNEEEEDGEGGDEEQRLKYIAPEIFASGYVRNVGAVAVPKIINDDEIKAYEKQGFQVMKFPRKGDGVKQYNIVCATKRNIDTGNTFPGIKVNKKDSSKPVLPKCFKRSQLTNKHYIDYFKGKTVKKKEVVGTEQQRVITTNKFLDHGVVGELPSKISEFFHLVGSSSTNHYVRKGIMTYDTNNPLSKYSFLSCILDKPRQKGQGEKDYYDQLKQRVSQELTMLQTLDPSIQEDIYFDPRNYRQLLETVYNINILCFTRNDLHPNGTFLIDNYQYVLFDPIYKKRDTVFVFEHMGSESDNATYPMCERIFISTEDGTLQRAFSSSFVEHVDTSYKLVLTFYQYASKIPSVSPYPFAFTSVQRDQQHNIRGFQIENRYTILCDPIQIFDELVPNTPFKWISVSLKEGMEWIQTIGGTPTKYAIHPSEKRYSNIYFKWNHKEFVLLCDIRDPPSGLKETKLYQIETSFYETYLMNKRHSRRLLNFYIKKYTLTYPEEQWSKETLDAFFKKVIVVGKSTMPILSSDFVDVPRIEVENSKIANGLHYTSLYLLTNMSNHFRLIYEDPFIYKYYKDITDFTERSNSYIVTTYESYMETTSVINSFVTETSIQPEQNTPYYMLLTIDDKMYQVRVTPRQTRYTQYVILYNGDDETEIRAVKGKNDGQFTLAYKHDGKIYLNKLDFI